MLREIVVFAGALLWTGLPETGSPGVRYQAQETRAQADTLYALTDFNLEVPGFAPYYREPMRDGFAGIAINSIEYEGEFAAADHIWTGASGVYDITIGIRPEFDGECVYILYINGTPQRLTVAMRTEVPIGPPTPHTWTGVTVNTGQTIRISSNNVTNGLLPEGDGTGFSRGRWSWIVLIPSP